MIFGNLGQDDIIGGSSNLFSLQLKLTPTTVSTTQQLVKSKAEALLTSMGWMSMRRPARSL